jgi:HPt (histidine-containing phosphotransfer) domain-containing protein
MVIIFVSKMPIDLPNLLQNAHDGNWDMVRGTAHKMKSSVSFMGMSSIKERLQEVENHASSQIVDAPKIILEIEAIKETCELAVQELRTKFNL